MDDLSIFAGRKLKMCFTRPGNFEGDPAFFMATEPLFQQLSRAILKRSNETLYDEFVTGISLKINKNGVYKKMQIPYEDLVDDYNIYIRPVKRLSGDCELYVG